MKWDKTNVIVALLGVAAIVCWYVFAPGALPGTSQPAAESQPAATENGAVTSSEAPEKAAAAESQPAPAAPESQSVVSDWELVSITGGDREYFFQPATGTLEKVVMQKMQNADRTANLEIKNEYPQLADVGAEYGAFGLRTDAGALLTVDVLKSERTDDAHYTLIRRVRTPNQQILKVEEAFFAAPNGQLQADVTISNSEDVAVSVPRLIVSAGDLAPWYKLSGDPRSRGEEHTLEYCEEDGSTEHLDADAKEKKFNALNGSKVRWLGASNRFFALLFKEQSSTLEMIPNRICTQDETFVLAPAGACAAFSLAPGAEKKFTFQYYLGAKEPDALKAFDPKAKKVMRLGWFPIDFIAYVMLTVLNWFYGFVGSFGWSIIMLTLLVRFLFFPVTMKANAAMREMSQLSPQIKEIREKYKDNPMVAQTKMQELYREHHVNPLSGCLPMLIQIPVFIALYYALGSAAELRQQSFWWIRDLAQPDTVAHVLGFAINPLIIAWTLLMIVQQRLTPTSMEPMQAKMMMIMPLVMLFFLYNLPAGLTLYWTVSQIFSICQMLYQQWKKKREEQNKKPDAPQSTAKPKIVRS